MASYSLSDLEKIIQDRAASTAETSYTKSLLEGGPARVAKKFGEEAIEVVIAAVEPDRNAVVTESADVLYHLLVLLRIRNISVDEVMGELERRTRQSGHAEKASRRS